MGDKISSYGHNTINQVRLEPVTPQSQDKHSTAEPLCSCIMMMLQVSLEGNKIKTNSLHAILHVFMSADFFFKINFFKTIIQDYHQCQTV